ncbi:DUF6150 family protein [Dyella jejuensis]|uniref:DUF6150 family protein n=1 Tax=Dyella jejuensis TaxID=1432009 RepID=UPI00384B0C5D
MARIFQVQTIGDADVRVALVSDREQADVWVHRVDNRNSAQGDTRWFITRNRDDATCRVCFCHIDLAQVRACFVDSAAEAGWRRDPTRVPKGCFAARHVLD